MSEVESNPERRIALFQRKEVRRTIHNNEWWFVITDVVAALTDSANPQGYLKDMRRRDLPFAEAFRGGGKLPPPLVCSSTQQADARCSSAGTPKASSVSSNPSPVPKPRTIFTALRAISAGRDTKLCSGKVTRRHFGNASSKLEKKSGC